MIPCTAGAPGPRCWRCAWPAGPAQVRQAVRNGDYIVAVINQELVTAGEVTAASTRRRPRRAARASCRPRAELRQQVLDALIEERVIITHARDSGVRSTTPTSTAPCRASRAEPAHAGRSCATGCAAEGVDWTAAFAPTCATSCWSSACASARSTSASASPTRDRPPGRPAARGGQADAELNIAQILVTVPEGASRRARGRAKGASRAGAGPRARRRGLRHRGARAVRRRQPRQGRRDRPAPAVAPARPVRRRRAAAGSGRGRAGPGAHAAPASTCSSWSNGREGAALRVTADARPAHPAAHVAAAAAEGRRRAAGWRDASARSRPARAASRTWRAQSSDDGSAPAAATWAGPAGQFVPEFEEAMNKLPVGGISAGGVALRRAPDPGAGTPRVALENQAAARAGACVLREQKFDEAYPSGPRTCARAPTSRCASRRSDVGAGG
jgi:peptidyl-prolyl cis-trans isomerase SurA